MLAKEHACAGNGAASHVSVAAAVADAPSSVSRCVLVVDDTSINRLLHARLVKRLGYAVETCNDGDEVLPLLEQMGRSHQVASLIMMDVVMPRLNGMDCCRELRARGYTLPIIAVTANATPADLAKYRSLGFDDLLPKPFSALQLATMLEHNVGARQLEQTATDMNDAQSIALCRPRLGMSDAARDPICLR